MAQKGRAKKLKNGLTPKQNAFKNEALKQITEEGHYNGTEIATKFYDVSDRATASQIATENIRKPEIKNAIEDALSAAGVSEATIMENIKKLATGTPDKLSGETVLKANLSILKLMGHDINGKNGKGKLKVTRKVETMGYSDAKKELQTLTIEQTEFVDEVEKI